VVLAESAHALQDRGLRDRHVSLAVRACGAVRPGNLMAEAVHLQVDAAKAHVFDAASGKRAG
jgi:hypothetical protein